MCIYFKFKEYFGFENYFNKIKNFDIRWFICKLWILVYKLMIEVGRYFGIIRNEWICNKCNFGLLGDEIYFLIKCEKFVDERKFFCGVIEKNS